MRSIPLSFSILVVALASAAFGQSDRGSVTGAVSDPTKAVVPGVTIAVINSQTGARYETISTETGNYTLAQLPAGVYQLSAELPGFKKYVRQGITVQVAQTLRIDVPLEVGTNVETVTIVADAALLRTEGGELSHNVTTSRLSDLPVLGTGTAAAGSSGIRNPLAVTNIIPGTYFQPNTNVRVNGAPVNAQAIRVEGLDATNTLIPFAQAQTQPSVDAIQEVSIQTSNFAAEYGATTGGLFNYTMKSGTNRYHGSVYDYFVNEGLNAGQPFILDSATGLSNPRGRARRNDYGFNIGGPVLLPKYEGRDKTFFFFNFEQYREKLQVRNQTFTVPTLAYRNGNFSQALIFNADGTPKILGTDPIGRPIQEGTIYDPNTNKVAPDGRIYRDPFPGNIIPSERWDSVAAKIQSLIPVPDNNDVVNNYHPSYPSERVTTIPALKIDHNLTATQKLSFYWSRTATGSQYSPQFGNSDGLPNPITAARGTFIESHVERLNYDNTLSPRMLLHVGIGYQHNDFKDDAPVLDFDAFKELGLRGGTLNRTFPQIAGLGGSPAFTVPALPPGSPNTAARGGMKDMGPAQQSRSLLIKPSANASLTWITNNHTYKFGSEFRIDGIPVADYQRTNGLLVFSANQTALPYNNSSTISGGTIGFPYASFLLGAVDNGNLSSPANTRLGKRALAFFVQDTWKLTRTLTLDYGLRWDHFTYLKEQYGRFPSFSPTTANPTVGGILGASIFEGDGPGHCNCEFARNYPWAFGPRIGMAYQITPKTVARVGWGITYGGTSNTRPTGAGSTNPFSYSAFGDAAMRLQDGFPLSPAAVAWPKIDPGLYPVSPGTVADYPSVLIDANAGRPSRVIQWSIGVQREIFPNLVVEASYVGNRAAWYTADYLKDINALTPERLAQFGLDLSNPNDRTLLTSPVNSAVANSRLRPDGSPFSAPPYPTFPRNLTVAQSLRPFPQFQTINSAYAPLGNTWYDALQVKATKRLSHGLDFSSTFSWQKELALGAENENGVGAAVNNVFDRDSNKTISQYSRPLSLIVAASYRVPRLAANNRALSWTLSDWQISVVAQYASGLPIRVPLAQSNLNQYLFRGDASPRGAANGTYANRVPDVPLFTKDLDCHCFDPNKDFVLNPAAWQDPAPGQFSYSPAYYDDYRQQRRPQESLGVGRLFRLNESGATLNLRVEFSNIFNRSYLNNPDSTNAKAAQTRTNQNNPDSRVISGFGRINTATTFSNFLPRQGTIVARLQF